MKKSSKFKAFLVTLLSVFLFSGPGGSRLVAAEERVELRNPNTLSATDIDQAAAGHSETEQHDKHDRADENNGNINKQDAAQPRKGEKEKEQGPASEKKKCGMEPQHKNTSKEGEALDKQPIKPWWWLFRRH